ncbi:MAG: HEAT repeat domain-containing protein [Candidatus Muirbacterium halophilum]|nr:HEAT repeat domain-containing protein [Candidatus Muirbacterium halophilum]MCK9475298.1 HEAT repeat domain-containing protein [Candidatus Muirbacterium halophilum]
MSKFDEVIFKLNSRNIKERIEAVTELGDLGDPRGVEYLINNLPELHSELRLNIIRALKKIKDPSASGPLIVVYDETPSQIIRHEIINALLAICDDHSINKLMQIVNDITEEIYLRVTILKEITKFRLKDSSDIINTSVSLLKDKNVEIRKNALNLINEYRVRNIQNYLFPLLKEDDIEVRNKALVYLYKTEGEVVINKVINILSSNQVDNNDKAKIVEVLGSIRVEKVVNLLKKLIICNIEIIRKNAIFSLVHTGEKGIHEEISKRLKDNSAEVRKAALTALTNIKASMYVKNIIPLIMDKDEGVRTDAVYALKNLINTVDLIKLEPLMKNPNLNVVRAVLEVFADKKYVPAGFYDLINSLYTSDDDIIKKVVIRILGINKDKKAFDKLLLLFSGGSENIKIDILYNLKEFKSLYTVLIPSLFEKYKDEDSEKIRAVMTDIIALGNDRESGKILLYIVKNETDGRTKSNAVEALENYVDIIDEVDLVNTIMPCLKDSNNRVKANAAKALWTLGGLRMVSMLEDMLRSEDRWQRASACFVLGEIAAIQVVPVLKRCLDDSEDVVRGNAVKALAKCGEFDVVHDYISKYNSETDVVRQAIVFSCRFFNNDETKEFLVNMLEEKNANISKEAAYSIKFLIKEDIYLVEKVSYKIEKLDKEIIKILVDPIGDSQSSFALELLERLSYYDDIEISSKASNILKKVNKVAL